MKFIVLALVSTLLVNQVLCSGRWARAVPATSVESKESGNSNSQEKTDAPLLLQKRQAVTGTPTKDIESAESAEKDEKEGVASAESAESAETRTTGKQ